jgi:hypothetical protein
MSALVASAIPVTFGFDSWEAPSCGDHLADKNLILAIDGWAGGSILGSCRALCG